MSTKFNFYEQREQSAVKTEIVVKYFDAWTKIIQKGSSKMAYVDLYAGPGMYDDGSKSTPILILEHILASEDLRKKVQVYFNEKDISNFKKLKNYVSELENISSLNYEPIIDNKKIDYEASKWIDLPNVPRFCFLDPSGYYGLSQNLIRKIGESYGTDIIFFFNFNDINRAVSNEKVSLHMQELFGRKRFENIINLTNGLSGARREDVIVSEMEGAMHDIGFSFVLPFSFKTEGRERTSHYVFFITRNKTAFNVMKDIMFKIGEKDSHGVGRYGFIPSSDKEKGIQLSLVDLYVNPYDQFKDYLCKRYAGKRLSVEQLYDKDTLNTPFVKKQYKDVLKVLEMDGIIRCEPSFQERRKNTFSDKTLIFFP